MAEVLILTGPPGAGKSTVAEALAERYDRVAHVPVDAVHEFITPTGHVPPWGEAVAWARQRRLLLDVTCAMARAFLAGHFAVIIDDTVVSAADLAAYLDGLRPAGAPVHFVRLLPTLEVCLQRNASRRDHERMPPHRVEAAYRQVAAAGAIGGVTIDSTSLSVNETADRLQALTTRGESLVFAPTT